jgi:hypothetical protein
MSENNVKSISQVFELKGDREYVHGTDIFNQLIANVSPDANEIADLEITFSRRLENTACIWRFATASSALDTISAPCRGKISLNGVMYFFTLAPQKEQGVRHRINYDEEDITSNSRTTPSTAVVQVNRRYTFIENLVALTKHFHYRYYALCRKQWMFGKIELMSVPVDIESIEIRLDRIVPNRLSKLQIVADDGEVGLIFFTVG